MANIRKTIRRLFGKKTNVLISGEMGSGKELIARAIHCSLPRSEGLLVRMSCRAMTLGGLEGDLFGIQAIHRGTLLIAEVDALSLPLQEMLVRLLQREALSGFGSIRKRALDIRLLATSNCDLKEMVGMCAFGKDLYDRLKTIHIRVSPLRERIEDIPLLLHAFLRKYCLELGKKVLDVPGEIMDFFLDYHWPGNVGELEEVTQRAVEVGDWGFVFDELKLGRPSVATEESRADLQPSMGYGGQTRRPERYPRHLVNGMCQLPYEERQHNVKYVGSVSTLYSGAIAEDGSPQTGTVH